MARSRFVWLVLGLASCGGEAGTTSPEVDASEVEDVAADASSDDASGDDTSDGAAGDAALDSTPGTDAAASDASDATAKEDAAPPPPSCASTKPCPATPSGLVEGGGPKAIERCAFVLNETSKTATYASVIAGLEKTLKKVSIESVAGDLNRTASALSASKLPGVPGFLRGFSWDEGDEGKAWWIPQGLTGSPDAVASGEVGGKKLVIVSWYYDIAKQPGSSGEKGIRISVADVTGSKVTYRHVLLVEPKMTGARPDFAPIDIHAGGVAWVGRRLWVADTSRGLRAFDLDTFFETATTKEVIGWDDATGKYQGGLYAYVLPQVAAWNDGSPCNPVFSFVGVDRGSSSLVTGEYVSDAITGRVLSFPIDLATGALAKATYADGAWVMGQRQVQGALTHDGVFYLSSSAPAAGGGVLYAARPGKKTRSYTWTDAPEDLMFDAGANALWGLSEAQGARWVFAVDASKIPGP